MHLHAIRRVIACCTRSWRGVGIGGEGILAATRRRAAPRVEEKPVRCAAAAATTATGVCAARRSRSRKR